MRVGLGRFVGGWGLMGAVIESGLGGVVEYAYKDF